MDLIGINADRFGRVVYRECFNTDYKSFNNKHDILVNNRSIM